ncbi:unnamed protein product, partial [Laminaria digitata]
EHTSVFTAGRAAPAAVGVGRGERRGGGSKDQQGRRRHDLSLPVCVDLTELEEEAGCGWPTDA